MTSIQQDAMRLSVSEPHPDDLSLLDIVPLAAIARNLLIVTQLNIRGLFTFDFHLSISARLRIYSVRLPDL